MPYIANWLINPFAFVNKLFNEHPNEWQERIASFFADKLKNEDDFKKIPWLNETPVHCLSSYQIVRFRGMIQDMFDPEFYLETFEVKTSTGETLLRPGCYRDIAEVSSKEEIIIDSPRCVTGDRRTYYCLSIPGENEWVKEIYGSQSVFESEEHCLPQSSDAKKRSLDDESGSFNEKDTCPIEVCLNKEGPKKMKEALHTSNSKNESCNLSEKLNFPIPDINPKACLVKIYDDSEFLLNEIIEVVGILSINPALGAMHDMEEAGMGLNFSEEEMASLSPPPSLVPRIHALRIRKIEHCNPCMKFSLSPDDIPPTCEMREMRETLRSVLEIALLGDSLAAEYILMHLASSVYLRQDVLPLGKMSVNISGINLELQKQGYPRQFYNFLQSLVTHSHFLPLTLENMNKCNFIPKKDYESNRLKSGLLQLPAHLHLMLDETQLLAGQLNASGVRNLTALGNLINWQKVDYDFQFHSIEQHTNVPVIILSEGKAMINSDFQIKLTPTNEDTAMAFSRVASVLTPEVLKQIRIYLTACRLSAFALSETMQKNVEDDFVSSRQHDNGMTADDLHNMLILARLLSLTCGERELTTDIWKCVKILETERKVRLK